MRGGRGEGGREGREGGREGREGGREGGFFRISLAASFRSRCLASCDRSLRAVWIGLFTRGTEIVRCRSLSIWLCEINLSLIILAGTS